MMENVTVSDLLRQAISLMSHEDARIDAEYLLAHCFKKNRSWLFAGASDVVSKEQCDQFLRLIEQRKNGVPVAYLIGERGFWNFDLKVNQHTLIPRPETELLVELALEKLPLASSANVLDMGTGTGAIAIALASERPLSRVLALDASRDALDVATENKLANKIHNLQLIKSDWFASVPTQEKFDLIVSNPPYISESDSHLNQGDLRYEPMAALASGKDGLDAIRIIVKHAPYYLNDLAWLMIEHGWDQGPTARALFQEAGFIEIETVKDLEQRDRVTKGKRSSLL